VKGDPIAIVDRKAKSCGHHADNRVGIPAEANCSPDDAGIPGETLLPFLECNNDYAGIALLIFFEQQPTKDGRSPRHAES
jgi:hypothetical protein